MGRREVLCEGRRVEAPVREVRVQVAYTRETVCRFLLRGGAAYGGSLEDSPDDIRGYRIRSNVDLIRRSLNAIVATLAEGWDIGEIVEAMSDAKQYTFRKGVEAVEKPRGLGPDGRRRAPTG
jgi:hypothetical protein